VKPKEKLIKEEAPGSGGPGLPFFPRTGQAPQGVLSGMAPGYKQPRDATFVPFAEEIGKAPV